MARVLEALGRYADAEDALFELIDERPDDPGPVEEAIAFCQRLRPLEPEQLAAGGLNLEEVNDTLAELLRRQPVPDRGRRRRRPRSPGSGLTPPGGAARGGCRGRGA